ncbi:MAG TPA: alpha/beta hydrolase [Actinophytocola sp.]|jgi:pimeloyl-ACP methyl ester carboxylesterase|nr:alpha/beta hydrolase [Actinophytocola sp.]
MDSFRHRQITLGATELHVVEAGEDAAPPILFLHGWPESWLAWRDVMTLAAGSARAVAVDMPGVGGSTGDPTDGTKRALAGVVRDLVTELDLADVTLVGQDVGGMITYAYLCAYPDLARAVIMDVVIPGLDPWEQVLANPYLWHFAFHAIPELPETLVDGHQRAYFDYYYDILSADPATITEEARDEYAAAYASRAALTTGFSWYRAFPRDAKDNASAKPADIPLLYLRGEHERGDLAAYEGGFRAAGLTDVRCARIPGAGHFAQEESPGETWRAIAGFAGL